MIQESDYLWWNDDVKVDIHVPTDMGGGPAFKSMAQPESKDKRAKSQQPAGVK